jgi:predicted nucleotidyltransferase
MARSTVSPKRAKTSPRRAARAIPAITPIGCAAPVSETLPKAVRRIARKLRPQKIILFGSYAYGNPTPDSDVDLLVVMQTKSSSAERSWAVSRLLIPRPFPVDILVRTPREITYALGVGDFFVQEIISQGQVLYERRTSST